MTTRIIIVTICVVVAVMVWFFVSIRPSLAKLGESFDNSLPSTHELTADDSEIIAPKYLNKIKVTEIARSKIINPVSLLKFDSNFGVTIYKTGFMSDTPLKNLVHLVKRKAEMTTLATYRDLYSGGFKMEFKDDTTGSTFGSAINLTLTGKSISPVVINDSIVSYHLLCHKWAVRYSQKDTMDIVGETDENVPGSGKLTSTNILLYKKKRSVYFLLVSPEYAKDSMPKDLLYKIITGR